MHFALRRLHRPHTEVRGELIVGGQLQSLKSQTKKIQHGADRQPIEVAGQVVSDKRVQAEIHRADESCDAMQFGE